MRRSRRAESLRSVRTNLGPARSAVRTFSRRWRPLPRMRAGASAEPAAPPPPRPSAGLFRTAPTYAVDSSEFELPGASRRPGPRARRQRPPAPAGARSSGDSEFDEAGFVLPGAPAAAGNRTAGNSRGTAVLPAPTPQQIAAATNPAAEEQAVPAPAASVAASAASGASRASGSSAASGSRRSGTSSRSSGRSFELKSGGQAAKLKTICDKCTAEFAVSRSLEGQPVICPACGRDDARPDGDDDVRNGHDRPGNRHRHHPSTRSARRSSRPLSRSRSSGSGRGRSRSRARSGKISPRRSRRSRPPRTRWSASGPSRCSRCSATSNDERARGAAAGPLPGPAEQSQDRSPQGARASCATPRRFRSVMRSLYEEKSPAVPVAILGPRRLRRDAGRPRPVSPGESRAAEHRERVLQAFAGFGETIVPAPGAALGACGAGGGPLRRLRAHARAAAERPGDPRPLGGAQEEQADPAGRRRGAGVHPQQESHPAPDRGPPEPGRTRPDPRSAGLRDNPDPKSAKFLVRSARDKSLDVRKNIVASMGLCGDESVVGSLKKFLVDPSRGDGGRRLGGDRAARPELGGADPRQDAGGGDRERRGQGPDPADLRARYGSSRTAGPSCR